MYADSQDRSASILDLTKDNDGRGVIDGILHMNSQERQRYHDDAAFRQQVDSAVKDSLKGSDEQLGDRLLAQIAQTGNSPQLDPISKVLYDQTSGASRDQRFLDIQAAMQNPRLRKEILHGDNQDLRNAFVGITAQTLAKSPFEFAFGNFDSQVAMDGDVNTLLTTGHLPLDRQLEIGIGKTTVLSELPQASPQEQQAVVGKLSPEEQAVARNVIQQGQLEAEDRLRLFALKDGPTADDVVSTLRQVPPDQLDALRNLYRSKYGSDLDADLLGRVEHKDYQSVRDALSGKDADGRQDFYEDRAGSKLSGITFDGTPLTLGRAQSLYEQALQQYQGNFDTLPPEQRDKLNNFFNTALDQYKASKASLAELIADGAVTLASLAAVPVSGGLSLGGLALVAGGGAALRLAILKGVEGDDFDGSSSNVLKQLLIGGGTSALAFAGPESIASLGTIARDAATTVVGRVAENGAVAVLDDVGEKALTTKLADLYTTKSLQGATVTEKDFQRVVDSVASGSSRAERCALAHELYQETQGAITDAAENSLKNAAKDAALPVERQGGDRLATTLANRAVDRLPDSVNEQLRQQGVRVIVTDRLPTVAPELEGVRPPGYPEGFTYGNVQGIYDPQRNAIVLATNADEADARQTLLNIQNVLRHETGHAFDYTVNGTTHFSDSPLFRLAYQKDLAQLSQADPEIVKRLEYFVQDKPGELSTARGREEAFAELFGILHGGGGDPQAMALLEQYFPNSAHFVQQFAA